MSIERYSNEQIRRQAYIDGVTSAAIHRRIQRTGRITLDPVIKLPEGNAYREEDIEAQAKMEGSSKELVMRRVRASGRILPNKITRGMRALVEYIADRDGVSVEAVRARVRKYGSPEVTRKYGVPFTHAQIEEVRHMADRGVPIKRIAEVFDHEPHQIIHWLVLSGWEAKKKPRGRPKKY